MSNKMSNSNRRLRSDNTQKKKLSSLYTTL